MPLIIKTYIMIKIKNIKIRPKYVDVISSPELQSFPTCVEITDLFSTPVHVSF